ncbi:MAG TPA: TetR/AcrR family transcriptional regulator [Vicinamibacterales bacterium]|nr:TetR/AcrR family transcriptional regulator [Vicinamibacterales bacterium]
MAGTESTPETRPSRRPRGRRRAKRPRSADPHASTRVDILKSAAKAFRKLGYHGATVEQIATALHMKKGNLYYYFRNKEEILFACHQYSLDRLMQLLEEVEASQLPPAEQLRRLVHAFVHTILDELHGTALFLDLEALTPAHLKAVIVRRDRFDHGVRQILENGMASGVFAQKDPKLVTFALMGAVNWIPRWFSPEGPATSEQIAEAFAEFFVAGLRSA